jgi:hypothetical protein
METYNEIGPKNWAVVNSDVAEYDEEQVVNQAEPQDRPGEQLEKERPEREEEEEEFDENEEFEQEPQQDEREDLLAP